MSDKKNLFNSVKMDSPNKNAFDLTHDVKLSLDMGLLVPTLAMDCVPGDKIMLGTDMLVRFAPLISPVMHRFDVSMHYFFVPNRLLWPNWENFITNTPVSGSIPAPPTFQVTPGNYTKLLDYLGIPPVTTTFPTVSALPLAAYQMIYNEYYRDQNLIPEVNFELVDGNNNFNGQLQVLRRRAWEHDYFTSALPFAQKGNPALIPLGIVPNDVPVYVNNGGTDIDLTGVPSNIQVIGQASTTPQPPDQLYAATANLTTQPTTINELRFAFRYQEFLEKMARGGSRLTEVIRSFFGVQSPDARLQRPEYITGTKSPVIISEVLNTSATATEPQGNMAGHAVSVTNGNAGSYFCQEHGYIIGIMSVMPKTAYQQGIDRHWLRINDPFEYYWPQFANIGEQEIQNQELYMNHPAPTDTFGYNPRYSEYKFLNNRVAGDFRTTLSYWHEGRIFATPPALNQTFIECTPSDRIFAVSGPGIDSLYAQVLHKITAIRAMPKYGTPTF